MDQDETDDYEDLYRAIRRLFQEILDHDDETGDWPGPFPVDLHGLRTGRSEVHDAAARCDDVDDWSGVWWDLIPTHGWRPRPFEDEWVLDQTLGDGDS